MQGDCPGTCIHTHTHIHIQCSQRHEDKFAIEEDHPFNPHVHMKGFSESASTQPPAAGVCSGSGSSSSSSVGRNNASKRKRRKARKASAQGLNARTVALDCEMVGVGAGGSRSALARCSIVDYYGTVVYDKFVSVGETVTDYRTYVSGIRPGDLDGGEPFAKVRQEVSKILAGKLLLGHSLQSDLDALQIEHPRYASLPLPSPLLFLCVLVRLVRESAP